MTYAVDSSGFTLNGSAHLWLGGTRSESFVAGSVKQWDGSQWVRSEIAGKAKERRISFSGFVETDEEKTLLEALRVNTVFTDFNDGLITSGRWVVMSLTFSLSSSRHKAHNYSIVIEEFNQT